MFEEINKIKNRRNKYRFIRDNSNTCILECNYVIITNISSRSRNRLTTLSIGGITYEARGTGVCIKPK